MIETDDHNITSKDYFEAGSECDRGKPFGLNPAREIECGRGLSSNCYQEEFMTDDAGVCRAQVEKTE